MILFTLGTQNTQYYVTRIPCQTCKITLLSEHILPVRYSPLLLYTLDIINDKTKSKGQEGGGAKSPPRPLEYLL